MFSYYLWDKARKRRVEAWELSSYCKSLCINRCGSEVITDKKSAETIKIHLEILNFDRKIPKNRYEIMVSRQLELDL